LHDPQKTDKTADKALVTLPSMLTGRSTARNTDWSIRLTREPAQCGRCYGQVRPGLALFADEDGDRHAVCLACGRRMAPAMVELLELREAIVARAHREPVKAISVHETRTVIGPADRMRRLVG
jgi:hypothetical protein